MPRIDILEINDTRATGAALGTDIAYVPGFADEATASEYSKNEPVLCSTISDFEKYFGTNPVTLSANSKYGIGENDLDKSYIYAKELIRAGLPVYYENICAPSSNITKVEHACDADIDLIVPLSSLIDTNMFKVNCAETSNVVNYNGVFTIKMPSLNTEETNITISFNNLPEFIRLTSVYSDCADDEENAEENNLIPGQSIKKIYTFDDTDDSCVTLEVEDNVDYYILYEINSKLPVMEDHQFTVMVSEGDVATPFEMYSEETDKVDYFYSVINDRLDVLKDKNEYTIKYITTGGYPSIVGSDDSVAERMMLVASERNDAVALVDYLYNYKQKLTGSGSVYQFISNKTYTNGSYGAMFTPYAEYSLTNTYKYITEEGEGSVTKTVLPASFGYLMCLARSIKTSPNWYAMAGITRGLVPNIVKNACAYKLSNVIADEYQPKTAGTAINAITEVKPYGLTIWGNRTLERVKDGLTATHFLNTRNMASDIKKVAYDTAKQLMFEQDSDTLWLRFKSGVTPFLEQLKTGYGISNYKLIRTSTKYNGTNLGKGEMACVIRIYPLYAIEYFEVAVVMADEEVSVN